MVARLQSSVWCAHNLLKLDSWIWIFDSQATQAERRTQQRRMSHSSHTHRGWGMLLSQRRFLHSSLSLSFSVEAAVHNHQVLQQCIQDPECLFANTAWSETSSGRWVFEVRLTVEPCRGLAKLGLLPLKYPPPAGASSRSCSQVSTVCVDLKWRTNRVPLQMSSYNL